MIIVHNVLNILCIEILSEYITSKYRLAILYSTYSRFYVLRYQSEYLANYVTQPINYYFAQINQTLSQRGCTNSIQFIIPLLREIRLDSTIDTCTTIWIKVERDQTVNIYRDQTLYTYNQLICSMYPYCILIYNRRDVGPAIIWRSTIQLALYWICLNFRDILLLVQLWCSIVLDKQEIVNT